MQFVKGITSAGESGYCAGELSFVRIAAQRYIRAQKTRSKCRRRFTALHHNTRTPRLRFPTHNFKFKQEKWRQNFIGWHKTVFCAAVWKQVYFPVSKAEGRQTVVIVEKVLSLFLFVEFEIIGGNAGWMWAENAWIQTAGYAFRRAAEEIKISSAEGVKFSVSMGKNLLW